MLATDRDREGEAIAWHFSEVFRLKEPTRVAFNEITKTGIAAAIKTPRSSPSWATSCFSSARF